MRVPRPPAITTAASFERESDMVGTLAGAPGFEPGITGPKPVALPLGYAPVNREAECTPPPGCTWRSVAQAAVALDPTRSSPIEEEHGDGDHGKHDDADDREQAGQNYRNGDEYDDELRSGGNPRN